MENNDITSTCKVYNINNVKLECDEHTFEDIVISALRYALKRHSYIVDETVDFISDNIDIFSTRAKTIMYKDILEVLDNVNYYKLSALEQLDYETLDFLKIALEPSVIDV